jgi:tRNA modification GTPase
LLNSNKTETLRHAQRDISILTEIEKIRNKYPQKPLLIVANKIDILSGKEITELEKQIENLHLLSAKTGIGIEELKNKLLEFVNTGALRNNETIITNSRHYDSLLKALEEVEKVQQGLAAAISGDLLAIDIRQALYHFGEITGEISSDDLLGNIFANFCIGK